MPKLTNRVLLTLGSGCLVALLTTGSAFAQLDSIVQTETRNNNNAQQSQTRIDNLAEQTRDLLAEYRQVVRETESLVVYNDQLERVVTDQRNEVQSINEQLTGLESTNRGVVPLMIEMVDTLDQIVDADIPFRLEARKERVAGLRGMIDRSDVTTSEKYRRIMEAYKTELEYGNTTEAYSASLPATGQTVQFLRIGRTLLFYQTSDGDTTGWYNPEVGDYEELDGFDNDVSNGLSIAQNQKAPDLVKLPVPAPRSAQ